MNLDRHIVLVAFSRLELEYVWVLSFSRRIEIAAALEQDYFREWLFLDCLGRQQELHSCAYQFPEQHDRDS
jgi:hypothetical protein